jgi:MerR family transcriptional regulator/heat shock protein HspR
VISVFAELAGVHPQTLRNYERTGLLSPQRTSGGSRRFSDADLAALRRIQELTNEGINLEGVKRIIELERRVARLERENQSLSDQLPPPARTALVPLTQTMAVFFK